MSDIEDLGTEPPAGATIHTLSDPAAIEFAERSRRSLAEIKAAAEAWTKGLGAIAALATGGLLVAGPSTLEDVAWGIAVLVVASFGGGVIAFIVGTWRAYEAASPTGRFVTLDEFLAEYQSLPRADMASGNRRLESLKKAKRAVLVGAVLTLAGIACWILLPVAFPTSSTPGSVLVVDDEGELHCGQLGRADDGSVVLAHGDETTAVAEVASVIAVGSCG